MTYALKEIFNFCCHPATIELVWLDKSLLLGLNVGRIAFANGQLIISSSSMLWKGSPSSFTAMRVKKVGCAFIVVSMA